MMKIHQTLVWLITWLNRFSQMARSLPPREVATDDRTRREFTERRVLGQALPLHCPRRSTVQQDIRSWTETIRRRWSSVPSHRQHQPFSHLLKEHATAIGKELDSPNWKLDSTVFVSLNIQHETRHHHDVVNVNELQRICDIKESSQFLQLDWSSTF